MDVASIEQYKNWTRIPKPKDSGHKWNPVSYFTTNIYSGITFLIIGYFITNSIQVLIFYLKFENTCITMLRWAYDNAWHTVGAK